MIDKTSSTFFFFLQFTTVLTDFFFFVQYIVLPSTLLLYYTLYTVSKISTLLLVCIIRKNCNLVQIFHLFIVISTLFFNDHYDGYNNDSFLIQLKNYHYFIC